jgi:hypothetical protein
MGFRRRTTAPRWTAADVGFTVIGLVLGALTVMTAAAVVATAVVLNRHKNLNPNDFSIKVTKTVAVRDTNDLPVITVSYRINFSTVRAVQAQETPVHVRCFGKSAAAGDVPGGDDSVRPQHVSEFGEQVIAPGETARNLEGPVQVSCVLVLSGASLSFDSDSVDVPKPASGGNAGGPPTTGVAGKYALVFTRSKGSETDCVIDGEREITVTTLTASTIHVALGDSDSDAFDSPVSADLRYAGALALNPGFADYYGRMDGQFASTANGIQVGGTMTTERPACTFSFQGSQH